MRQQRTLQTGIHLFVKDPWVDTDEEADFEKKIEDSAVPIPYLPNSIKTDGFQVKVLLSTLEATKNSSAANAPLPNGVSELVLSRYFTLQATCNAEKQSAGVFKKVKALPKSKELQGVEVVGLDPG